MKFHTKLWRRSQKSFATTVPHIALLEIDESKDYSLEWEYDKKLDRWAMRILEAGREAGKKAGRPGSRKKGWKGK